MPTWRFFDRVGPELQLWARASDGEWTPVLAPPPLPWYALLFNPRGNHYHACMNLLQRFVEEIDAGAAAADRLVSFALLRKLAGGGEFKITVDGETVLESR